MLQNKTRKAVMKTKHKWGFGRWLFTLVIVAALIGGGYYAVVQMGVLSQFGIGGMQTAAAQTDAASLPTVEIQSVDVLQTEVSASGNLALVDQRSVALEVAGIVQEVLVEVGDKVAAGDTLLRLDTTDLERSLALAELSVESAKLSLADVQEPATAAELAQAQAALQEAQANLLDVQAGPSAEEIAAARSNLAAAQASYAELNAGPSEAELTQLSASLKKAEIALAEAQGAYDKVAWQGNASSQSADLQSATIDYESAKAAYAEATAAASNSDLQNAVANIQSAQNSLNELVNSPTQAEIATA
jgi:multidrug efflux pump subunit AcrA (membrane-fusion protein)